MDAHFDDIVPGATTTTTATLATATITSNQRNYHGEKKLGCKQCGEKKLKSELKASPYPKQDFHRNQRFSTIAGASSSEYLVCPECFTYPECIGIGCKCKFKTATGEKLLCDRCRGLDAGDKWDKFDETRWKCQHCRDIESSQRRIRYNNNNNNNTDIASNDLSSIRKLLRSPSLDVNDIYYLFDVHTCTYMLVVRGDVCCMMVLLSRIIKKILLLLCYLF